MEIIFDNYKLQSQKFNTICMFLFFVELKHAASQCPDP